MFKSKDFLKNSPHLLMTRKTRGSAAQDVFARLPVSGAKPWLCGEVAAKAKLIPFLQGPKGNCEHDFKLEHVVDW
jgi:hypothetical protein